MEEDKVLDARHAVEEAMSMLCDTRPFTPLISVLQPKRSCETVLNVAKVSTVVIFNTSQANAKRPKTSSKNLVAIR